MQSRDGWRRARLETVLDLSLALAGPREERDVVEELVQRAVGLLDARAGFAFSLLSSLEPVATAEVGWRLDRSAASALATAPALQGVRGGELARLEGAALQTSFGEVLVAPCIWQGDLMGLVGVADKETREGRARFDDEDETFLRSLALLAAPAIASSRAFDEVSRRRLVLEEEIRSLRARAEEAGGLVGESPAMRRALDLVGRVAPTDVTVLLRGESGTGKERVARLIHELSPRREGPFVPLNCAAVPETLLEAELFGIEAGVATGVTARLGKFELAGGGTLFLDEVGDLSPALQAKLLRVVQEREVERVGGRKPLHVDVRLLTATNRDLETMMAAGDFRADLYYRLRVVELTLPPLRQRRGDVPLLANHFVQVYGRRFSKADLRLSRAALEILMAHEFPGNVRELENIIEASVALTTGQRIEPEEIALALGATAPREAPSSGNLDAVIRSHVLRVLEGCGGNRSAAARELAIDRSTLHRMLARWNATDGAIRNNLSESQS